MKRIFCMLLSVLLLVSCFVTVFAEEGPETELPEPTETRIPEDTEVPTTEVPETEEPVNNLLVTIQVESNVETAEITLAGESYMPETTTVIGKGEFILDFEDGSEPGDIFHYTISQTGGIDETYVIDTTVYGVDVYIFFDEVSETRYAVCVLDDGTEFKPDACRFNNTLELIRAKVTVTKKSSDTKLPLAGAEIGIFDNNDKIINDKYGKPATGLTDENGQIVFEVVLRNDTEYYAQEIKAPAGYDLNTQKFYMTRDEEGYICAEIELEIIDQVTIIPPTQSPRPTETPGPSETPPNDSPGTGDNTDLTPWIVIGLLAVVGIVGSVCFLSKKKESEAK